jgi:hypothetical protein
MLRSLAVLMIGLAVLFAPGFAAAVAPHDRAFEFEASLCDADSANCGQPSNSTGLNWMDIINHVSLPGLPAGSYVAWIGWNGDNPPIPIMTVNFICGPGRCTPPSGYRSVSDYVKDQVLSATNSVGFSVRSALESFGISTALNIRQVQRLPHPPVFIRSGGPSS